MAICTSFVRGRSVDLSGHFVGGFNVPVLRSLVAAAEEDDQLLPATGEVEAITGAEVDLQFGNASADRAGVAEQAGFDAGDADPDDRLGLAVLEAAEPLRELRGLLRFHTSLLS